MFNYRHQFISFYNVQKKQNNLINKSDTNKCTILEAIPTIAIEYLNLRAKAVRAEWWCIAPEQ